ncbi:hypothetical protein Tsubulata_040444 [Turnera subulata]|uniref:Mitochondrial adenine nucleotide transporter BTL3 n=1 Tax=Turnera subulata TaxID=218843 RepID=A0A9Q0GFF8_9ROSI|nr:hypothetical protein Tsubulata_040444 [Turnera subulata]
MLGQDHLMIKPKHPFPIPGGLFLHHALTFNPSSFYTSLTKSNSPTISFTNENTRTETSANAKRRRGRGGGLFLSVSLSIKQVPPPYVGESPESLSHNRDNKNCQEKEKEVRIVTQVQGWRALNTLKHLSAGAVSAAVSKTFLAPLERLKLEYIVRGERKTLLELIKNIAVTHGLKSFWKGNLANILRTAPFKAINFYAYDAYRNQLLEWSGDQESTNFDRFLAGAAAGITATLLCLPMDTVRTKMVAPGGEALGGITGTFRHLIQTEGFFSLYKGLLPSIVSMAPSGAVFYGVYDILKSAYLHSPEGRKRIQNMKQEGQESSINALDKMELGPFRTLLYGAIAGCCSEAATYPFEVVRRHLQMQVKETKMSAVATCIKLVEQGGIPALYAGLVPSLLQVLPSAAISYLVYEFMKIVLKVEST